MEEGKAIWHATCPSEGLQLARGCNLRGGVMRVSHPGSADAAVHAVVLLLLLLWCCCGVELT